MYEEKYISAVKQDRKLGTNAIGNTSVLKTKAQTNQTLNFLAKFEIQITFSFERGGGGGNFSQ